MPSSPSVDISDERAARARGRMSTEVRKASRALLGGYEQRVRFFLGLLVFVLAAANTANFLLLRSASDQLRDSVEEAVDLRGTLAARALLAQLRTASSSPSGARGLAGRPEGPSPPARLHGADARRSPSEGGAPGPAGQGIDGPQLYGLLPSDLQRIAESTSIRGLSLLDASGRVIVAGDGSPQGSPD